MNGIAKEVFGAYGRELAKRSIQLGEEYADRTWEMLQLANEEADGSLKFPLFPQRFIEIAYLSIQPQMRSFPIIENNMWRLRYKLDSCTVFDAIKEQCGEKVSGLMPCKHICLALCQTAFQNFDLDIAVDMEASMAKDNECRFHVTKT